jgi:hypothetical protein
MTTTMTEMREIDRDEMAGVDGGNYIAPGPTCPPIPFPPPHAVGPAWPPPLPAPIPDRGPLPW